jgi:Uncharacterized protein, possibly involved in aromatic compounds catabolism
VSGNDEHYRKLERMYLGAPINRFYNPVIRVSEGRTEITIPVKEELFHAAGAIHGSVYFKALDDAAFFAAASLVPEVFVLTVSYTIYLTRPVISEAVLHDSQGKQAARGSGTFMRSQIALTPEIGYK